MTLRSGCRRSRSTSRPALLQRPGGARARCQTCTRGLCWRSSPKRSHKFRHPWAPGSMPPSRKVRSAACWNTPSQQTQQYLHADPRQCKTCMEFVQKGAVSQTGAEPAVLLVGLVVQGAALGDGLQQALAGMPEQDLAPLVQAVLAPFEALLDR